MMIYLDYHATTPVFPEVWEAMRPYLCEQFGNPASAHSTGRKARKALEDAREKLAALLGAFPDEVIFTSGATEANNLALFGLTEGAGTILASPLEHPCVVEPLKQLQLEGYRVETLPVTSEGIVDLEASRPLLTSSASMLTTMLVNHETGAIQPIAQLRGLFPGRFHCDAAQAVGKIPVNFHALGIEAMSLSAHKFHGPKGIGALLLARCTVLKPMLFGGHQQKGKRPGTESVASAVGMVEALSICVREIDSRRQRVEQLRTRLVEQLHASGIEFAINTPLEASSAYVLNLSFPDCRGELLLMKLDLLGVAASTGSACSSGSLLASPVLTAMRLEESRIESAMRFSFDPELTEEEIDLAAKRIVEAVQRVRS
jgi:cysteine desulfurase